MMMKFGVDERMEGEELASGSKYFFKTNLHPEDLSTPPNGESEGGE